MTVDAQLDSAVQRIRQWGCLQPTIRRIWVYGSRVRGTQSDESDLDIAIEIDPIGTDEESQLVWTRRKAEWVNSLKAISPFEIHLEMLGTPKVSEYLEECSKLIFER